jgi:peptidoglycan/LPS O-acetylase OafA/YrhL
MSNGNLCCVSDFVPRRIPSRQRAKKFVAPRYEKWKAIWLITLAMVSIALAALSWRFVGPWFRKLRWQPAQSVSNRGVIHVRFEDRY